MRTATARRRALHPVHAVLLVSILPLFLGALLSDWAYSSTYVVQWINFAAWLNGGAMLLAGLALAWAIIGLFRADAAGKRRSALYLMALIATFAVGLLTALIHTKDAAATMPAGLIMSLITFLLALASVWLGFSIGRPGDVR